MNTKKSNYCYYSFKDYLIENYGVPFYRVPIDLALSCPHKTGKSNGCIFCAEDGARAVHLSKHLNLELQVINGIKYVENRYKANGNYIAYFQSYTNTNADVDKLKKLYYEVLNRAEFKIVIISTRPDCLSDTVISLLNDLNKKYDVWIELGVQTANNKTLKTINRGHDFAAVQTAVSKLHSIGIKTVAHVIVGLPDEIHEDCCNTINEINKLPFTAVKIHNLLLLKNSPLARIYNKNNISMRTGDILIPEVGTIKLMNEYDYAGTLIDLIRRIPNNRPLLRITADAPSKNVIGPKWTLSKGQFLELIKSTMRDNHFFQGDLFEGKGDNYELGIANYEQEKDKEKVETQYFAPNLEQDNLGQGSRLSIEQGATQQLYLNPLLSLKVKTEDNSFTFYSPKYKENYHSVAGAASETENKFIIPSKLEEKLISHSKRAVPALCKETMEPLSHLRLLDIGFGLGYNAVSAIKTSIKLKTKLSITSLEMDTNTLNMGLSLYDTNSLEYEIISSLQKYSTWSDDNNSIDLIIGDARKTIDKCRLAYLQKNSRLNDDSNSIDLIIGDARKTIDKCRLAYFDIIFLDAFSAQRNPELWTYDFMKLLYKSLNDDGVLVTYSAAFPVRGAMFRCGFCIGTTKPFGRRKGGTIAYKNINAAVDAPILEKEQNIVLKSTVGVPYRDPCLNWTAKQIFNYKDKLSKRLRSKGIPKWYK